MNGLAFVAVNEIVQHLQEVNDMSCLVDDINLYIFLFDAVQLISWEMSRFDRLQSSWGGGGEGEFQVIFESFLSHFWVIFGSYSS